MQNLLTQPEFLLGLLVAFVAGALGMLAALMAFDALEDRALGRSKPPAKPTVPPALQANGWGDAKYNPSARADMRSRPR